MAKVAIVVNPNKPSSNQLVPKLKEWLSSKGKEVWQGSVPLGSDIPSDIELAVCLGGDGTILSAARSMQSNPVPLLGVNLGSLGFLTEVKQEEVLEELGLYLEGKAQIEKRLMLSCLIKSDKRGEERTLTALNDIVINREGLTRILRLEVYVSGERMTSFAGDGVIIATPTGSTAYSLSAGGAVIQPKLSAFIITPICPHATAMRSMVLSDEEKIMVKLKPGQGHAKAVVAADGQENMEIDDSFTVEITCLKSTFQLMKSSKRSYFANLRENFKFPE